MIKLVGVGGLTLPEHVQTCLRVCTEGDYALYSGVCIRVSLYGEVYRGGGWVPAWFGLNMVRVKPGW